MSTHLTRIVEAFNAGRLDEVVAHTTEVYHYSDPFYGRVEGPAAHQALMRDILDRFPDRKIEVLRSWTASNAEFAEYRWTGTRADDTTARPSRITSRRSLSSRTDWCAASPTSGADDDLAHEAEPGQPPPRGQATES